ncbi:MAG TPA: hypothetical protein VFB99_03895 [Vicinamibacterales bacterium]|nr:hypothetical protein [Vicinamibacterales bacterium]
MKSGRPFSGYAAMAGGAMAILLAPVMVIIKYMTGWAVVPEPLWVGTAEDALGALLQFATPPGLWMAYGTAYTIALSLMLVGFIGLSGPMRDAQGRLHTKGYWIVLVGLCIVIPGDAIHTWTWHQNGLRTPTPGTNPLANTAYAAHMMGMNFIMVGSLAVGVSALRRKFLAPWLAWSFLLILPSAVVASTTLLPTTPSGALWWFSVIMLTCGYFLATGNPRRLVAARQ